MGADPVACQVRRLLCIAVLFCIAVLSVAPSMVSAVQAPDASMAYIERGHQTETRQHAYHERMERLHDELAEALRRAAPDLLPKLEPPPAAVFGYGILPRIGLDEPVPTPGKPQIVRFSWAWSDTLIAREMATLDHLEADLSKALAAPAARAQYESLVAEYTKAVDSRRPIDSDVDYNWLWQKRIAERRPLFDRLQVELEAEVQRQAQTDPMRIDRTAPMIGFDPPAFVRIEQPTEHEHLVIVPLYSDITDRAFVEAFVDAVEKHWHVRAGDDEYRVRLVVTTIAPDQLYCGGADRPAVATQSGAACAGPGVGEKIDLAAHEKRFPEDGPVLTTGAAALQLTGKAIVLGSHDLSPRTLAHEFGHLVGFPDGYLRGYRDLGADGFQVLEFVVDQSDIMSSPGSGSVLARHLQGLIMAKEIQTAMQAGLAALYQRNDPLAAVICFREVLARNPTHFGATLQLAKALDRAGQPDEALVVWKKMLDMAEAAQNTETIATARARLATVR